MREDRTQPQEQKADALNGMSAHLRIRLLCLPDMERIYRTFFYPYSATHARLMQSWITSFQLEQTRRISDDLAVQKMYVL